MGLIHGYRTRGGGRNSRGRRKKVCKRVETGETRKTGEDGSAEDGGKVVRIPRDWFGPPDELVPLGRSASHGVPGPEPPAAVEPGPPVDPNRFWDESSSSIQEVVEASGGAVVREVAFEDLLRRVRQVPRRVGVVKAAAFVLVALVVGVSVVGWLLGSTKPRAFRTTVASIGTQWAHPSVRHLAKAGAGTTAKHERHVRPKAGVGQKRSSPVMQVAYRSNQPSYSPPPPSPTTAIAATNSGSEGSRSSGSSGATASSAAAASQSSPPAFGANGALGPMSSPAG